jgi:hypothetical protein
MWDLMILGHVWMGLLGLGACALFWPWGSGGRELWRWEVVWPVVGVSVAYLLGQVGMMYAMKHDDPSRVTPLFSFKVLMQAVVTWAFGASLAADRGGMTWLQWVAVGLCVAAAVSMNFSGKPPRRRALLGVAWTVVVFAISDYHIGWLVRGVGHVEPAMSNGRVAVLAAGMQYVFCGLAALPCIGLVERGGRRDWGEALPFAAAWFGSMMFLFAAFGLVGVVLGSILQSTRGLMTMVLAAGVARLGHEHIEPRHERGVILRRAAAGLLMFVAVSLYVIKDPRLIKLSGGGADWRGVQWSRKSIIFC